MATHAETMVAALKTALEANPMGVVSVTIDGVATAFNHTEALNLLRRYERQVGRQRGTRPTVTRFDLSRF